MGSRSRHQRDDVAIAAAAGMDESHTGMGPEPDSFEDAPRVRKPRAAEPRAAALDRPICRAFFAEPKRVVNPPEGRG